MLVREKTAADRSFLLLILIWVAFGLIMLASASAPAGYEKFHDAYYFVKRQIWHGLLPGLVLFFIFAKINYEKWRRLSWVVYSISLVLLILVYVPGVGMLLNGSRSWIQFGAYSFQPSEFAKLAIILIAANILSDKKRDLQDWRYGLSPIFLILLPAPFLVALQPDIGTLSILAVIIFVMLYFSRVSPRYLVALGVAGVVVFSFLMILVPRRIERLTTFLHPELDPLGVGYQVNQAFLAIGSGGFWGFGLGHSRQKFQYLPEASSDSIFAVLAEELGFFVSALFVILIALVGKRGFWIARSAPDEFGALLVGGIMVWLIWQSFLNIGAMVGILPLTGVPLPFVSHGGSAMAMGLAAIGVVASVSRGK